MTRKTISRNHPAYRARLTVPSIRTAEAGNRSPAKELRAVGDHHADPVTTMIETRKKFVLEKAIKALELCDHTEMKAITHEMGGAIAFYTYLEEGEALTRLSRWIESNLDANRDLLESKRREVLELLHMRREQNDK